MPLIGFDTIRGIMSKYAPHLPCLDCGGPRTKSKPRCIKCQRAYVNAYYAANPKRRNYISAYNRQRYANDSVFREKEIIRNKKYRKALALRREERLDSIVADYIEYMQEMRL